MKYIETSTACGNVKGIDEGEYVEYRSIRYATSKRFEYPEIVTQWDGVYDATYFKACSYQKRAFEDDEKCNAFYHKEFRKGLEFTYDEDCLFLNIWAPANAKACPVMVYIHGGSFTGGSSDEGHLCGKEYAKNGVVLVTMNYRLGPFGFCSHPDLKDEDGICGNYGLYDQYTAIKWVKDNIAAFGGDPDNMTLCGQSAGAMSVDIQLTNPMCKDYFKGAILMSGAALQRSGIKPFTPEKTENFWNEIIKNAAVSSAQELKEIEPEKLFYAWEKVCKENKLSMPYTFPVYDGRLLRKEDFTMDKLPDIPYILGITSTDMIPAVLEALTKKWAKRTNCYTYIFARNLPGDENGAWHACDLLYAFSTLGFNWRPFTQADYRISNEMLKSFVAFAKSGDPNCNAIDKWSCSSKKSMIFCEETKFAKMPTGMLVKNTFTHGGFV